MRHIVKGDSLFELEDFKRKNPHKRYKDLKLDVKSRIKTSLLNEQEHLCCYCEKKIDTENSHIEHIKPQSKFPTESLDYDNLLASCNGNNKSESCGHKKDDWYCENTFIHPLKPKCLKNFQFLPNGEMIGKTEFGKTTVQQLGLNCKNLQARRRGILTAYRDLLPENIGEILKTYPPLEFISAIQDVLSYSNDNTN
jgi:uncharacterized protein (TIGR02646 family)